MRKRCKDETGRNPGLWVKPIPRSPMGQQFLQERINTGEAGNKDFRLGYSHGIEAASVNSGGAFVSERYYKGYIAGMEERHDEPAIVFPDWITPQQVDSVKRLYLRNPDGSATRMEFFRRVDNYGEYCGFGWCNMFIGIEQDGYTHS